MRDIIGLKAEIGRQLEEAREFAESARVVHEDAQRNLARLQEFFDLVEDYRGERRNASRTYDAPGAGTKAEQVEVMVTDILRARGSMRSEDILARMAEDGNDTVLPGETRTDRLARLATYLTRMHRRPEPAIAYDRETRMYSVVEGK